jgi:hypothetical protein
VLAQFGIEEGTTQFLVSANAPAEVEEAYITASEDEAGAKLKIYYEEWNKQQRVTLRGAIQVELDPDNFTSPLRTYGTLRVHGVSINHPSFTGTMAYPQVMNHPMEPACLCLDAACYERESPNDTILIITGIIRWDDCEPGDSSCMNYGIWMLLPFIGGNTFATTCDAPNFDDPPDSGFR